MSKMIWLLLLFTGVSYDATCQDSSFSTFNYGEIGSTLKFSVQVPSSWIAIPESEGTGYFQRFYDSSFSLNKKAKNCIDSAVYRLKYISGDLSQAMAELGFSDKGNGMFMIQMNKYISVVVGFEIKGHNYVGIDCSFKTNAICQGKIRKAAADMHYLLFSNGKETVCLLNNGIELSDQTTKALISSFRFN